MFAQRHRRWPSIMYINIEPIYHIMRVVAILAMGG